MVDERLRSRSIQIEQSRVTTRGKRQAGNYVAWTRGRLVVKEDWLRVGVQAETLLALEMCRKETQSWHGVRKVLFILVLESGVEIGRAGVGDLGRCGRSRRELCSVRWCSCRRVQG